MKRTISLLILTGLMLFGQSQKPSDVDFMVFYAATYEVSLSGTAGVLTIQVPANASKRIYLQSAMLWCSVACTVVQERNGAAATATALTPVPLNTTATAVATVYSASNAGVGSALPKAELPAGTGSFIDLSFSTFQKGVATVQNYNLRTSTMTGTARLALIWGER